MLQSNTCMASLQVFDNQLADTDNRVDDLNMEIRYIEGRVDEHAAEFRDTDDSLENMRDSINQVEGQVVVLGEDMHAKLEMASEEIGFLKDLTHNQENRINRLEDAIRNMAVPAPPAPRALPGTDVFTVMLINRIQSMEEGILGLVARVTEKVNRVIESFLGEHRDWMERQDEQLPDAVVIQLTRFAAFNEWTDTRFRIHYDRFLELNARVHSTRNDFLTMSTRIDAVELSDNSNKRARIEASSSSTTATPIIASVVHMI
jgi:hypothetical protein